MFRNAVFTAVLGTCILLSGCGDGPSAGSGSSSSSYGQRQPSSGSGSAGYSGSSAGQSSGSSLFRLTLSDGQPVTVRGPAALFFFTSWCGYCKQVLPEVNRLTGVARSRGWRVYGVQVGEGPSQVNGFIQQYNPSFPVLMDQNSQVAQRYGIRGYPTFVLVDANGNIVYNAHEPPRGF